MTVRDLLEHAGGLAPRLLDAPPPSRREFEHDIATMPLEYAPRTRSLYTDLGFILLGFVLADRGGPIDAQFAELVARLRSEALTADDRWPVLMIGLPGDRRPAVRADVSLPEDNLRQGRLLVGEVHDNYAYALGGVAGRAGLFGNVAGAVGDVRTRPAARGRAAIWRSRSRLTPCHQRLTLATIRRSTVPGSSRALGWDTMRPTSSCGTKISPAAFGHVGFTGVSLWIDPVRDRYFILLTNRVCGTGTSDEMQEVRRTFHDLASEI